MTKQLFSTILLILFLMIISCNKEAKIPHISLLEKAWTQSYEEMTSEGITIYRPNDYKDFPASRYRQIFNFHSNNKCDYLVLSANDGQYTEIGSWEYNDKTNILKILNSHSELIYEFEVFELTENLLKLKVKN